MKISVVLDRRSFLMGAAGLAGAVAVTVSPLPGGWRLALQPLDPEAGSAAPEWAVDHVFGTYPPYAHPIPYGRQVDASAAPLEPGAFDPVLMI